MSNILKHPPASTTEGINTTQSETRILVAKQFSDFIHRGSTATVGVGSCVGTSMVMQPLPFDHSKSDQTTSLCLCTTWMLDSV